MNSIDKSDLNSFLNKAVAEGVDIAICRSFQYALDKHNKPFGMYVSSSRNGPNVEFFTPESASAEAKDFCEKTAAIERFTTEDEHVIFWNRLRRLYDEIGSFTLTFTGGHFKVESIDP